jgi:glutaredoxin
MPALSVVIYSKTNCGLCDDAVEVVERVQQRLAPELAVELRVIDITTLPHAELLRYRYEIPVVFVNGQDRFHHRVDEGALEGLLKAGTPVAESRPDTKATSA